MFMLKFGAVNDGYSRITLFSTDFWCLKYFMIFLKVRKRVSLFNISLQYFDYRLDSKSILKGFFF